MKATVLAGGALLHQPPTRYVPEAAEEGSFRSNRSGARYARRSPASDGGLRGSGGSSPPDRCGDGFIERGGRVRPPRPGSAKPRVGAPVCRRSPSTTLRVAASPPQRRIMAPLCVRSPPATARADAVRVWGFTRWGFRAQRRAGTERGSVPLALPGRGCVLGDAGNDRAEHRRRIDLPPSPHAARTRRGGCAPLRHGPQWPGALVALRQAQGFAVGAHGARPLRAKPAPRVRRSCSLQGNPRARFPWPAASTLRQAQGSSVRPSPFPRSWHYGCGAASCQPRRSASRLHVRRPACRQAGVDTAAAAGSGPEAGNRPCGPIAWKTTLQDGAGRAIRTRPLS
jgi:hypothetical protein